MPAETDPHHRAPHESIGLALSGGGFRASIFHLGVILRLEELGVMPRVSVISAVSGGSIVAAFYACEMERELRSQAPDKWTDTQTRVEAFEKVAEKFLKKVRLNMRSRALVFTPFYHPWLFVKAVALRPFREHAFSIWIQREYDLHFYDGNTLDQLPAVPPDTERIPKKAESGLHVLTGPKLLLNTTSLMTGERKAFSRDRNTYLAQLKSSNRNVLKLSQVVGASAGVPVLFPPTAICGELLVDGGVSDNQGIEGLLPMIAPRAHCCPPPEDYEPVETLLISDACGQLELVHTMSTRALTVSARVNDVLMHQVRGKLLDRLASAKENATGEARRIRNAEAATGLTLARDGDKPSRFRFAFVHLLLNLKDDPTVAKRVSTAFLEPLARLRTDLDQFSYIEAEALMYHGYTTIDAMVRRWTSQEECPDFAEDLLSEDAVKKPLRTPPLFTDAVMKNSESRRLIRTELIAGSQKVYLLRCWQKLWKGRGGGYRVALILLYSIPVVFGYATLHYFFAHHKTFVDPVTNLWSMWFIRKLPAFLGGSEGKVATVLNGLAGLAGATTVIGLTAYVVLFAFWFLMAMWVNHLDAALYRRITKGRDPEKLAWQPDESAQPAEPTAPAPKKTAGG